MPFLHFFLAFFHFFELEIEFSKKTRKFTTFSSKFDQIWPFFEHFWRQKCLIFDFWRKSRKLRHFRQIWRSCVSGDLRKWRIFDPFSSFSANLALLFLRKLAFFKKKVDFDVFFWKFVNFREFHERSSLTYLRVSTHMSRFDRLYGVRNWFTIFLWHHYVEHVNLYVTTCRDITHYNFYMLQHVYNVTNI
jgi:hypothetical protein